MNSQQLNALYEQYKTSFVIFTQEVIKATGLCTKQVYLKCMGNFWPCVLHSSSFETAKIVVNIKTGLIEHLRSAKSTASLHFCFKMPESSKELIFFVNMKSIGFTICNNSNDVAIFTFQYIQRPPDNLIDIMGRFLSENESFFKRRSERIALTSDSIQKLNIAKEGLVLLKGVSRNCLIRDISFFNAKIIVKEPLNSIEVESVVLNMNFSKPAETFMLPSSLVHKEILEQQGILVLELAFNEEAVPINYKRRIDYYFRIDMP